MEKAEVPYGRAPGAREKFIPGALSVSHMPQFQFQPFCILKNPLPTFLRNLGVKVIADVSFIKS